MYSEYNLHFIRFHAVHLIFVCFFLRIKVATRHLKDSNGFVSDGAETASVFSDDAETASGGPQAPHPQQRPRMVTLFPTYGYKDPQATRRNKDRTSWDVPKDFKFPTADLYVAWTAWLKGYPMNMSMKDDGTLYGAPIRPLYRLNDGDVPFKTKRNFDNNWRPILDLMHAEVKQAVVETATERIDSGFIKTTFDHALRNVCAKYPEIAGKIGGGLKTGTCCKMIRTVNAQRRRAEQAARRG